MEVDARRAAGGWWRDAVIYQLYPRSFADGNGDGIGDIAGICAHLDHLVELGVDAVWINPWYPSPMADGGYDVADYRQVDPLFGTLEDADALIAALHDRHLRVLLDIVPNHTSIAHQWFRAALEAAPGSLERRRYLFRPGRNGGTSPPNDWKSLFGGPAWTRIVEPDGSPGEWYLHLFAREQPDLDWDNAEVREEFQSILRFWFDKGVDGFRIDVANSLSKQPDLPDLAGFVPGPGLEPAPGQHPFFDRDMVHEIFRGWRDVADSYPEPRVFVAEAWVANSARLARYVAPGQLHTAFNFEYLAAPWLSSALRRTIDQSLAAMRAVGAMPTWVLSNHDVARHVTRFAYPQTDRPVRNVVELPAGVEPDLALGTRRARAAALLMLALPGGAYVYQGEELGLPEVMDLPDDALQDPTWLRSGKTDRGRDGCRVPLPWSGDRPPFGFSPPGSEPPWLPQPSSWRALTVTAETGLAGSMLELYRSALALRRGLAGFHTERFAWLPAPEGVLAFERGDGIVCVANVDVPAFELPPHRERLLASGAIVDGIVPPDTAVWLRS